MSLDNLLKDVHLLSFDLKMEKTDQKEIIHLTIEHKSKSSLLNLADEFRKLPGVEYIEIIDLQTIKKQALKSLGKVLHTIDRKCKRLILIPLKSFVYFPDHRQKARQF